ncbi:MAG: GNAT family N-acetyltransferase [Alphaproteobacteria bacterium]|nr:MAG: GNAT family N-acetyltransferase [Alphaproteobacteria bacterium]
MREHIELRDVTPENRQAVVDLELGPEQRDLVASTAASLAEARRDPDARPRAIYAGGRLVGFLMYDAGRPGDEPREALIYRFMIDRRYQGGGYGRAALARALDEIRALPRVSKIVISYMPDNPVAKPFYASFGFREVGTDEDGEMIAELVL